MTKKEIEELRIGVNKRLAESKYKDDFLEIFGELDCMKLVKYSIDSYGKDESDPIAEKLKDKPSILEWKSSENESLAFLFGEEMEKLGEKFLEIKVEFGGRNISGVKLPVNFIRSRYSSVIDNANIVISNLYPFIVKNYVFSSVLDRNSKDHKSNKRFIKDTFNTLKDVGQIAARFELAAALFGDEYIDRVLAECGEMSLKELRYAAGDE